MFEIGHLCSIDIEEKNILPEDMGGWYPPDTGHLSYDHHA